MYGNYGSFHFHITASRNIVKFLSERVSENVLSTMIFIFVANNIGLLLKREEHLTAQFILIITNPSYCKESKKPRHKHYIL